MGTYFLFVSTLLLFDNLNYVQLSGDTDDTIVQRGLQYIQAMEPKYGIAERLPSSEALKSLMSDDKMIASLPGETPKTTSRSLKKSSAAKVGIDFVNDLKTRWTMFDSKNLETKPNILATKIFLHDVFRIHFETTKKAGQRVEKWDADPAFLTNVAILFELKIALTDGVISVDDINDLTAVELMKKLGWQKRLSKKIAAKVVRHSTDADRENQRKRVVKLFRILEYYIEKKENNGPLENVKPVMDSMLIPLITKGQRAGLTKLRSYVNDPKNSGTVTHIFDTHTEFGHLKAFLANFIIYTAVYPDEGITKFRIEFVPKLLMASKMFSDFTDDVVKFKEYVRKMFENYWDTKGKISDTDVTLIFALLCFKAYAGEEVIKARDFINMNDDEILLKVNITRAKSNIYGDKEDTYIRYDYFKGTANKPGDYSFLDSLETYATVQLEKREDKTEVQSVLNNMMIKERNVKERLENILSCIESSTNTYWLALNLSSDNSLNLDLLDSYMTSLKLEKDPRSLVTELSKFKPSQDLEADQIKSWIILRLIEATTTDIYRSSVSSVDILTNAIALQFQLYLRKKGLDLEAIKAIQNTKQHVFNIMRSKEEKEKKMKDYAEKIDEMYKKSTVKYFKRSELINLMGKDIDQMPPGYVRYLLMNAEEAVGYKQYTYNVFKQQEVPIFKNPEMATLLDHIFTIQNGKLTVDLSKIWSSTDTEARDRLIYYLKVFKDPQGIATISAAEIALMTHYRLYIAQPDLQLANKGALGKKIMKLYEFYQDLNPFQEQKNMSVDQKTLFARKALAVLPLKSNDGKEIEQIQPCEHHKEVFELIKEEEFSAAARVGFVLNGNVDLDKLEALFKVNGDKIAVELEYETEGKVKSEAITVGNVLWEKAEKKNGNVADLPEPNVAKMAIKFLLGEYIRLYWLNVKQFQSTCMFQKDCELTNISSVFDNNGLSNAAAKIHKLRQVCNKNNKTDMVKINKPPLTIAQMEERRKREMADSNLFKALEKLFGVAIDVREKELEKQRQQRLESLKSKPVRQDYKPWYIQRRYSDLTAGGKELARKYARENNLIMRDNHYVPHS